MLTIGSLFSGTGGLDMAAEEVFGARTAWVSDIDKGACKILAHRYPGVPNLGDITTVDWADVEPVDIITGGSPCQDLSHAGRRAGMSDGTRSNLWAAMREAIAVLKPAYVIWENVHGSLSASADSALEHCPGCMGSAADRGHVLRALGRVLGDLADLGYDAQWHGLRASDLGACHHRFRVFVVAHAHDAGRREQRRPVAIPAQHAAAELGGREPVTVLPTPEAKLASSGPDYARMGRDKSGGHDLTTAIALLPTPRATDGTKGGPNQRGSSGDLMLPSAVAQLIQQEESCSGGSSGACGVSSERTLGPMGRPAAATAGAGFTNRWGDYAPAIARHARWLGRTAPDPTETGPKGGQRLSPRLVEWMMCLPEGWVCDTPGLTRNEALKALGNGVIPPQAAHAIRVCLAREAAA